MLTVLQSDSRVLDFFLTGKPERNTSTACFVAYILIHNNGASFVQVIILAKNLSPFEITLISLPTCADYHFFIYSAGCWNLSLSSCTLLSETLHFTLYTQWNFLGYFNRLINLYKFALFIQLYHIIETKEFKYRTARVQELPFLTEY